MPPLIMEDLQSLLRAAHDYYYLNYFIAFVFYFEAHESMRKLKEAIFWTAYQIF
jgi:hypothetical protein